MPFVGFDAAGDDAEQGGLAGTVDAYDADSVGVFQTDGDVGEDGLGDVTFGDVFEIENVHDGFLICKKQKV